MLSFDDFQLADNERIPLKRAQGKLDVSYDADEDELYTMIMYDTDAPYPSDANKSPLVHHLVVNIPGNDIEAGDELVSYLPPSPPSDSPDHRYHVVIYHQEDEVTPSKLRKRTNFNIEQFLQKNNIDDEPIESLSFRTSNQNDNKFINNHKLDPRQQKYCSCLVKVAAKEPKDCLNGKKTSVNGKKCVNPYAICAHSTKSSSHECSKAYNFQGMSDDELLGYAHMKGITVPRPFKREKLLQNIETYSFNIKAEERQKSAAKKSAPKRATAKKSPTTKATKATTKSTTKAIKAKSPKKATKAAKATKAKSPKKVTKAATKKTSPKAVVKRTSPRRK
jgi:phosphatidylethanolamine-binding protein (PEBP) family uncharacterized protein